MYVVGLYGPMVFTSERTMLHVLSLSGLTMFIDKKSTPYVVGLLRLVVFCK